MNAFSELSTYNVDMVTVAMAAVTMTTVTNFLPYNGYVRIIVGLGNGYGSLEIR